MASTSSIERKRGIKDAAEQITALREKWPAAFPSAPDLVRPLAIGIPGIIADSMGWTVPYALGVLAVWKGSPSYCEAVLRHVRINLDGSSGGDAPDTRAKDMAEKQLANNAAKKPAQAAPKVAADVHRIAASRDGAAGANDPSRGPQRGHPQRRGPTADRRHRNAPDRKS
jgi:sRNA-binding protein